MAEDRRKTQTMGRGKLIVLEGIDGSGKSAHYRRICEKLRRDGIAYDHIVFPRYDKESSALIRMYLSGEFGSHPGDVNAYTASTFFAVDRFASYKQDWGEKYREGSFILSDRYTTSNAIHQGSKLSDHEQNDFFAWLSDLEYNKMGLPMPDLVVYLDVTIELSLARMRRRQLKTHTSADISASARREKPPTITDGTGSIISKTGPSGISTRKTRKSISLSFQS